ncbi:hypothetical protein R1sor_005546 [Riccia sorocarpa]|uniref:Uncharacterized protein n=1 Tax=Riccia sorocarpa TaxID=122646 RepID=A0ABD3HPA8_9MARC
MTVAQFSSNEQLNYVYRACAFRRGKNDERMCRKSVERLQGYSSSRRLSLDADHVCGEHGWEWAWFFHVKLRDNSVAAVPLMQLPKYTIFQAGSEFFEISPEQFASWSPGEKSTFLEKKSKDVVGDWEVCIEARLKDSFRDAKVTYFSRYLNCLDNLPAVYEVEQKFMEQVTISEPAVSYNDTHLVATAENAVRALRECRSKVDSTASQIVDISEQLSSIRAEIEEVKSVVDNTERAVQDILTLIASTRLDSDVVGSNRVKSTRVDPDGLDRVEAGCLG